MAQFIVDDGVKDRGHRFSLFNENFLYFGSSSKRSGDYIVTVMEMASENLKETGVVPAGCETKKVSTAPPLPQQQIPMSKPKSPATKATDAISVAYPKPMQTTATVASLPTNAKQPENAPNSLSVTPGSTSPLGIPSNWPNTIANSSSTSTDRLHT